MITRMPLMFLAIAGSALFSSFVASVYESRNQSSEEEQSHERPCQAQGLDEALQEYRSHLVAAGQKAQEDFDKTVLWLSSGALGISFAFLKDIVGTEPTSGSFFLFSAWASWVTSLFLVLVSYYTSHLALRRTIDQIDKNTIYVERAGGWYAWATSICNVLGALFFVVGVVLMIVFVWINRGVL